MQNYFYDLHDQLVKVEIFKKDGSKETWAYHYDSLGRRIGKGRLKNGGLETVESESVSDRHSTDHACLKTQTGKNILDSEITFLWDGSHLLQETHSDGLYTYIYTDQDSYEPLAQIRNWTDAEGEAKQQTSYFHCDQIGIPREMTDKDGNLLWFGNYYGWGKLKSETNVTKIAHQPFRLQNQYFDLETGLHYNFFRYYEPDVGRFVNQDPIGLNGGGNFYFFASNIQIWIDPLGWVSIIDGKGNTVSLDSLGVPGDEFEPKDGVGKYQRPCGTTAAQRKSVQGKECASCGAVGGRRIADHIVPLVVEFFATGTNDLSHQTSVDAVQPHCSSCSSKQGGKLSAFSRKMGK